MSESMNELRAQTKTNDHNVIKCGDYVIVRRIHDKESIRLIRAETNKPIYLGKQKINLNGVFGQFFGSSFEINKNRELTLLSNVRELMTEAINLPQNTESSDLQKDNRFVLDDGKSQKLSKDDIEVLKSRDFKSKEIIDHLVKNSSTFDLKTPFGQQKYLKKKQKKYSNLVTILRPSVRLLTEMYFSRGPQKIDYLRIDSLSQMLSHCNVMSGRKYIVLDTNLGLLTAAVIERLGSDGAVIQVYTDSGPVSTYRHSVDALNLPKQTIDRMLFGLQINEMYNMFNIENGITSEEINKQSEHLSEDNEQKVPNNDKQIRKTIRRHEAIRALDILRNKEMDGLLFLTKSYDPLNILLLMLQFLSDSRPFAIFSPYIQPLTECYFALKKKSVFLKISETWLRKYQVLNDRTRPEMTMSSASGYVLTGFKVKEFENQ